VCVCVCVCVCSFCLYSFAAIQVSPLPLPLRARTAHPTPFTSSTAAGGKREDEEEEWRSITSAAQGTAIGTGAWIAAVSPPFGAASPGATRVAFCGAPRNSEPEQPGEGGARTRWKLILRVFWDGFGGRSGHELDRPCGRARAPEKGAGWSVTGEGSEGSEGIDAGQVNAAKALLLRRCVFPALVAHSRGNALYRHRHTPKNDISITRGPDTAPTSSNADARSQTTSRQTPPPRPCLVLSSA
jgi:hypothetical protein